MDDEIVVPRKLIEACIAALQRHLDRDAPMRVPVDESDSDVVRAKLQKLLADDAPTGPIPTLAEMREILNAPNPYPEER